MLCWLGLLFIGLCNSRMQCIVRKLFIYVAGLIYAMPHGEYAFVCHKYVGLIMELLITNCFGTKLENP